MNKQEAIKYLEQHKYFDTCGQKSLEESNEAIDIAIQALREPDRKSGRWVYDGGRFRCSECEQAPVNKVVAHGVTVMDYTVEGTIGEVMRYCPKCGAKMEGAE